MHNADKIFLIGFMGSGKTTAGRRLASSLEWDFVDLDELIEKDKGMPVAELFESFGEDWFRIVESETLRRTGELSNTVISTGGGTPCFFENMNFMIRNGITVYLRMTPENLARRLSRESSGSPLLKGIAKKDLPQFIADKLSEREHWYSMAEIISDTAAENFSHLLSLIKNRLSN